MDKLFSALVQFIRYSHSVVVNRLITMKTSCQNYQRTYLLSLFVWSALIGAGLIAAPKVMEAVDSNARQYQQFQQTYVEPLQHKIQLLEAEQRIGIGQHQQEIDTLKETIEILERDVRGHHLKKASLRNTPI